MIKTPVERLSEDAAEQMTVTGWVCKNCRRYWGDDERMARYCCSTSFPCECGKRRSKHYTCCDDCRSKHEADRFFATPVAEWDGGFPLVDDGDHYMFDEDDLAQFLEDSTEFSELADVRLMPCQPTSTREFIMSEHLQDSLAPDQELDDEDQINEIVNKWIEDHKPISWEPRHKCRLDPVKVAATIEWSREETT